MTKRKKRFKRFPFIRIYLTLLVFFICFLTIFAYRFDVMHILNPKHTEFFLSSERKAELREHLKEYEFKFNDIDIIGVNLSKIIPEYSFSIYTTRYYALNYLEEEIVETDNEKSAKEKEEQLFYYMIYGDAPNQISTEYSDNVIVKLPNGSAEINLYPKFTGFLKNYILADFIVSLLITFLFYLLLHLEKKYQYFKKGIKNLQNKLKWAVFHKLSLKLALVNILAAMFAFGSFFFMYINRYAFFEFIDTLQLNDIDYTEYVEHVRDATKDLKLNKKNKLKTIDVLSEMEIQYSYIYDKKGIYYVGNRQLGNSLDMILSRESIYDVSAVRTPKVFSYAIDFQNQTGSLVIYSYPLIPYVVPYVTTIVLIAISLFLILVLGFFNKKVKEIRLIQEDVLILANGNLDHEITTYGKDEIAQLGDNLNMMRLMLNENIQNEELSRKNNSELITSMSHDLRTPLTSIKAYLEVLKYRKYKDEEQYEKCLDRSIKKTEEIKEMTDAMFEYSLVFEPDHQAHMEDTTLEDILPLLIDQMEQLEMSKYEVDYQSGKETCRLEIDVQMLKRVFNNIFSNIQKYANPSLPIIIHVDCDEKQLKMVFSNGKKENLEKVERNHIGLKSTEKMMNLMNGRLVSQAQDERFTVTLWFPVIQNK